MEENIERDNSATCMACGWGEGGGQRREQMRRAGAKKGGGGGATKWADAECGPKEAADAARASKRLHGGALMTMEWWCESPDGASRWRYSETTEESGDAVLTLPQKGALVTISGPLCGVYTVGVPRRHL